MAMLSNELVSEARQLSLGVVERNGPDRNPFQRSGVAALSDFQTSAWRDTFSVLEAAQSEFLSKQHLFRSPEYKWPLDALHNWSRCWEYPYAYHHLLRWLTKLAPGANRTVADVGSGVTFFPFSVARLGCHVTCTDIDPICEKDLLRAKNQVPTKPGDVSFRRTDGSRLPFADGECGAVYCISVLEHIAEFSSTVREITRILQPGGLFILTVDLDLQGNQEIRVDQYDQLIASLRSNCEFVFPQATVHPADILLTTRGPCAMYQPTNWDTMKYLMKQKLKYVLRRPRNPQFRYYLAVEGFVLRKV